MRIFRPKTDNFFSKSRTCRLHKNIPFLSGIQNDDAYLLYLGVAGPGYDYLLNEITIEFFDVLPFCDFMPSDNI